MAMAMCWDGVDDVLVDDVLIVTAFCHWSGPLCAVLGKETVDGENEQEKEVVCPFNSMTWELLQ
jgi:hypothetical protein